MIAALEQYEAGLLGGRTQVMDRAGRRRAFPVAQWSGAVTAADEAILGRCSGPTLDIGCGAGRLTAALGGLGIPALGVDISAVAVALTIRRGAVALQRNVFEPLPRTGGWSSLLLADGNIGIGGDPVALLQRCRALISGDGAILVDLLQPGSGLLIEELRLVAAGHVSAPFRWCHLGVDVVPAIAARAGLRVAEVWSVDDRWQAALVGSGR
ncbi:MAG: class I SAM-dependent methyltransferase [Nakamurella sp.]